MGDADSPAPDAGNTEDVSQTLTAPLDPDDDAVEQLVALVDRQHPDRLEQAPGDHH